MDSFQNSPLSKSRNDPRAGLRSLRSMKTFILNSDEENEDANFFETQKFQIQIDNKVRELNLEYKHEDEEKQVNAQLVSEGLALQSYYRLVNACRNINGKKRRMIIPGLKVELDT